MVIVFKNTIKKFSASDFLLLLLPLTPVVQYILNNQSILTPIDSLYVLIFFVIFSSIYIIAIPLFLGVISSTHTLMILGLAFVYTIISMASLSHNFSWFEIGNLKIQLLFFGGVYLVTWILYNINKKMILHFLISVSFVVNSSIQFLSQGGGNNGISFPNIDHKLITFVQEDGSMPIFTPNIY